MFNPYGSGGGYGGYGGGYGAYGGGGYGGYGGGGYGYYAPPTPPTTLDIENRLDVSAVSPITVQPIGGYSYQTWQSQNFPGFNIKFNIHFTDSYGQIWLIEAHVKWNKRSWFDEEPYALSLKLNGASMENPTSGSHRLLWSFLVHRARKLIADGVAYNVLHRVYRSPRITLVIVEDLIAKNKREELYAIFNSDLTPLSIWDSDAWSRFLDWQTRS